MRPLGPIDPLDIANSERLLICALYLAGDAFLCPSEFFSEDFMGRVELMATFPPVYDRCAPFSSLLPTEFRAFKAPGLVPALTGVLF